MPFLPLQWSHGLPAMDTSTFQPLVLSIGTLQWSHGLPAMDTRIWHCQRAAVVLLQWSHGLPAMDTSIGGVDRAGWTYLQWSHGLPAMDTELKTAANRTGIAPSMEPWPPSHGYYTSDTKTVCGIYPSMEPWPPSHGYPDGRNRNRAAAGPSMEPWPPSHGYIAIHAGRTVQTDILQWSHGLPAMDTLTTNWPLIPQWILQWSHGLPAMDTPAAADVNVRRRAPSMEPWPPSHGYNSKSRSPPSGIQPSMEPWPPSHGYGADVGHEAGSGLAFNGAMASQPWIRGRVPPPPNSQRAFNGAMASQPWIHGCQRQIVAGTWPSMEPWPPSHGYTGRAANVTACRVPLQWSHGLPAMDTAPGSCGRSPCTNSFNGAMASQPWIPPASQNGFPLRDPLQWSHGLPAMDTPVALIDPPAADPLQWSHGLPAMDTFGLHQRRRDAPNPSMEPWPPSHGYMERV